MSLTQKKGSPWSGHLILSIMTIDTAVLIFFHYVYSMFSHSLYSCLVST